MSTLKFPLQLAPISRNEPRLWVKELAVYENWSPDSLLRHIPLRRGLNIIWAKPSLEGAAGHAAGKTTFCRFLRYLLGDLNFGSDTFRDAFRSKLPNACLAGEVYLEGKSWLVVRSFGDREVTHWCVQGATLKDLFSEGLPRLRYADFTRALQQAFIIPLQEKQFPACEKPIAWHHLLAWLSRDQEARYDHVLNWRSRYSEAGGLGDVHNADRTFLVRMILDVLGDEELKTRKAHVKILQKKRRADELLPKLLFSQKRAEAEYRKNASVDAGPLSEIGLEASIQGLVNESIRMAKLIRDLEEPAADDGPMTAEKEEFQAQKAIAQESLSKLQDEIKRLRLDIDFREQKVSEEEYRKQLAELPLPSDRCGAYLANPEVAKCSVAKALHPNRFSAHHLEQLQATTGPMKTQLAAIEAKALEMKKSRDVLGRKLANIEKKIVSAKSRRQAQKDSLNEKLRTAQNQQEAARRTLKLFKEVRAVQEDQKRQQERQQQSLNRQGDLRKKPTKEQSFLSDLFSSTAHTVLKQENWGGIRFGADEIVLDFDYNDLTSTALQTLKILLFDLTALQASFRGAKLHPGFLIHDSPREADLTASIYQKIFKVAHDAETPDESSAFQYIITTTEPPPENLIEKPWLVHPPFSSAKPAWRFLGRNL